MPVNRSKTERLSISLPAEVHHAISALAEVERRSIASLVRNLLIDHVTILLSADPSLPSLAEVQEMEVEELAALISKVSANLKTK